MALALLAAAGALWLRVAGPFPRVFRDGWVNFQGDAWYHMRAIEHLVRNFPHRIAFDPYAGPGAPYVAIAPLLDYLVAATAMLAGLGAPSAPLVERIAAYAPTVLGAIAVLLVYALGVQLFDRRTGVLGAALLAIMPGPFLDRTLLGATDHHALEVVLVLIVMCLVAAFCRAAGGDAQRRRAAWAAGAALGAYYLTWTSAPLFAFALALWASLQFLLNRAWGRPSAYLSRLLVRLAGVALAIVLVGQNPALFRYNLQLVSLVGLLALGMSIAAAERWRLSRRTEIAIAISGGSIAVAGLALGTWHLPVGLVQDLLRFEQGRLGRTITEMQPLLSTGAGVSLAEPWRVFRTAFYLGVPALIVLAVRCLVERDAGARCSIVVWGTVMLAATLGQVRFGYYLSPLLALLTAWTCSSCVDWLAARAPHRWLLDLAVVGLAATVLYPTLRLSLAAVDVDDGMSAAWKRSLDWLRLDTPDPFGNADTYFQRYDRGPMPQPSYFVMNWWDYGYWITRAGRRVPIANPTQGGAVEAGRFFTSTNEADAAALLAAAHARYAIVDSDLAFNTAADGHELSGRFDAVVQWAGRRESDFFETVMNPQRDGRLSPIVVFYPAYYRSMAVRLSRFAAGDIEPDGGTWVVSFEDRAGPDGRKQRAITRFRQFATYGEAESYLTTLGPGLHRIVGLDPARSCVPLPALRQLRLVHEESSVSERVRIFAIHATN